MTIAAAAVLVTGADRGMGLALAWEALSRGVKRVHAGTRQPLAHPDRRVTPPLAMDGTDTAQIRAAAGQAGSLDILINNAGVALYDDLNDRAALEHSLAVNFDGVDNAEEDIFPDPMSASTADSWRGGAAKALERENAALAQAALAQASPDGA